MLRNNGRIAKERARLRMLLGKILRRFSMIKENQKILLLSLKMKVKMRKISKEIKKMMKMNLLLHLSCLHQKRKK